MTIRRNPRRTTMRMLTKAEACRELAVSLSTLDRRIASGEVHARREPRRQEAPGVRDAGRRPAKCW